MTTYWVCASVLFYIIGCIINYGLLLSWWCATNIYVEKELKTFKKQAIIMSMFSWLSLIGTYVSTDYGKYGIKFK